MPPKAAAPKAAPKPSATKKAAAPVSALAKLKMQMKAQKEAEERAIREAEEEEKRIREEERLLAEERRREEEERERAKQDEKLQVKADKKMSKQKAQQEALERMRAAGMIVPDLNNRPKAPADATVKKEVPKPKPKHVDPVEEQKKREEEERKRKLLAGVSDEPADDWEAMMQEEEERERLKAEDAAATAKAAEKAKADALAASGPQFSMRSPICCVLGHVDTGKTSLLDRIRRTNVQGGEAGGITQQIGATFFPRESIEQSTAELRKSHPDVELRVPGLLVIDTPGHESFTNLRSRGSSLCDISVLVVDIMHGLEPQTKESIRLLRERKCPFIVALNKVDRLLDWEPHENMDIEQTLKLQKSHVQSEFETRWKRICVEFAEESLNAELYWKNTDMKRYVSVVPTSAKTGEGICDLLFLEIQLVQRFMENKVTYKDALHCTVLEVKPVQGFGTTIDVVLVNGVLNEGDTIMVCGLSGPIITQIRALLTPQPMKELRVKGDYVHHQSLRAAIGLKISAQDLEEAVPGTPLYVVKPGDDVETMKKEIMADMNDVMSDVAKNGVGVTVQSSTLGALEALLSFLKDSKIPVAAIALGPLHKKHLINTAAMKEKSKRHAVVLAFDVDISKEAAEYAAKYGIPIFQAKIIYHLFDSFTKYQENYDREIAEKNRQVAVFPVVLTKFTKIRNKDPVIVGCNVTQGQLHVGTPLAVQNGNAFQTVGTVVDIQDNEKPVKSCKKGKDVTIKIAASDTSVTFGRTFVETSTLVSALSRQSIDALKESFRNEMQEDDWKLVIKLKKAQNIP